MALLFKFIRKEEEIHALLQEIPLLPGEIILDYGAGPGAYAIEAAKQVGSGGHVYSADIHPLAGEYVQKSAQKLGLTNITPITTNCILPLEDDSVDDIFLFDVIHHLNPLEPHLKEFKRVLKPTGHLILKVDHHDPAQAVNRIEQTHLFQRERATSQMFFFTPHSH